MLDGYIIDAIKREERARQAPDGGRPRLHLPIGPFEPPRGEPARSDLDEEDNRGVVTIPLGSGEPLWEDAA